LEKVALVKSFLPIASIRPALVPRSFVRVNCASIPFDLAESELFGYEKGSFTGSNASVQ
jgi:transcriptional regulator with GAF, ATPase, and Fis domain